MRDHRIARDSGTETANAHSVQRFVSHHGRTHLDLFSGIGGFALAAAAAGFQTIGFSEIDPYACTILEQNWPDIRNYGDIRNIRGVRADLVTGGFPCQPFSLAGKRRGASDDRALWPEMLRVIDEAKPAGCLVKMLLESSAWNSTVCFLTWKVSATPRGRLLFRLVPQMPDTEETEYGLWPTPKVLQRDRTKTRSEMRGRGKRENGEERIGLDNALADAIAREHTGAQPEYSGQNAGQRNVGSERRVGGKLNPNWVEWLMGYPIGWTDLKDSATPSCRKSPPKS